MVNIEKNDFLKIISTIKSRISETKIEIFQNANKSLLNLYYDIGRIISEKSKWGNKFIDDLAMELKMSYPSIKGFSVRNLKSMKKYYLVCSRNQKVQTVSAQIPWSHNMLIIDKISEDKKRIWYMEETRANGWSYNLLAFQIKSNLYERQANKKKLNNYKKALPTPQGNLADEIMKDPYILNFTELEENYSELDLEKMIVKKIKDTLLELGNGFSFIGEQYRIEVANKDYFIDLLFYHTKLHCHVVVELKNTEFKPEYIGKISFYLSAIDEKVKSETDNPSIGLILCREKDRLLVEYALKRSTGPIGVSSYKVGGTLPKELTSELPSEDDLNLHINMGML